MIARFFVGVCITAMFVTAGACAGSSDEASDTSTTAPSPPPVLRVLVTNDDGVRAPGIDALTQALSKLPDTQVTIIAPAENQSGVGGKVTGGNLVATDATTKSGLSAKAVKGTPTDAVIYALDQKGMEQRPHVVLSGVNEGPNLGPVVDLSGTVGAARSAARHGIPALAASQGLGSRVDFDSGVKYALEWLAKHRSELIGSALPARVDSLNIPSCESGQIRGMKSLPLGTQANGRELFKANCSSTVSQFNDDVDGFDNGYVTLTESIPIEPAGASQTSG